MKRSTRSADVKAALAQQVRPLGPALTAPAGRVTSPSPVGGIAPTRASRTPRQAGSEGSALNDPVRRQLLDGLARLIAKDLLRRFGVASASGAGSVQPQTEPIRTVSEASKAC